MDVAIVTLFPEMFKTVTEFGITGRASREGLIRLRCWNPRDFTRDRHRTVDDRPFGGGPGMLMKTEPLRDAIRTARAELESGNPGGRVHTLYLSPQGRQLDQRGVEELAGRESMILVCGRYQGIDQRLLDSEIDEEWSIGDYVLSGGELAAMVLLDTITRYQPGALGDEASAANDSFAGGLLHCPEYTRPQQVAGKDVPDALLSGNHEEIRLWRLKQSLGATWLKRPGLLRDLVLTDEQKALLQEFIDEHQADPVSRKGRTPEG